MLNELRVNNLALIDSLHLDLSEQEAGLIVLTGETGAGKSIILQAVHLLGGGRSSASWVRNGSEQAEIEAVFDIHPQNNDVFEILEELSLRDGTSCLVRRVISSQGRSRLYVNDGQVTSRAAGNLAAGLVNIASQHDNQQLLSNRHQLDFLDSYGDLWPLRMQFSQLFAKWQKFSSELRQLLDKEHGKEQHKEFLGFQLEEIENAHLIPGEDEQLHQEKERMKVSSLLAEHAQNAWHLFAVNIIDALSEIRKDMEQVGALDKEAAPLSERIISACYEVSDIEQDLARYLESIPKDQNRLEQIAERLAQIKQLERKHGPTLEDVLAKAESLRKELEELEGLEAAIAHLEQRLEEVSTEALLKATELSAARREVAMRLKAAMEKELGSLSFNQAVFEVDLSQPEGLGLEGFQSTGRDTLAFLFSANPGEPPKSLAKIASGGELSRLMLAMKCILAKRDKVETVIFDEIDAGISGEAAEAVARKIGELASHHQVVCITHLPQIAAGADMHFKIEKIVEDGRTRTVVHRLAHEERVAELARMLGGQQPTQQTLAYAQELVNRKGGTE
ncbi:DNA repair protein RecN [Desulfogranum japonicum]|uniref:DNA repair protein RecN n=1 Tax=Desulfogranum japonicum TaxID=231447 RepID=UPI0003F7580C|nr:DNA repair protein RecN [Desulfogranum japonicum]